VAAGLRQRPGPGANLALLLAAAFAISAGVAVGALSVPESVGFSSVAAAADPGLWSVAAKLLSVFFSMNLVLLLLNLIPFPPLDGSAAIQLLMSEATAIRYQDALHHPALGWIGMVAAWFLFPPLFHRAFAFALGLLYPGAY
jgi:Zn-dependent protease